MGERDYQLTIDERPGYLHVVFRAETNRLDMIISYGNQVAAAVRRTGKKNILFENHAPILYERQAYIIGAAALRNSIPYKVRIAILDKFSDDNNYFADATDAARSVGLTAHYFHSIEAAEAWFASEASDS